MNFQDLYKELQDNKINHDSGYFNCIPFVGMERLERFLPGVEQDTYYLLTASSGVGKSKLARYLFIHNPYNYVKNNPDMGIKLDIKYFSLEESKKKIILAEISKYLYTKHGISLSIKQLQSRGRYNTLSQDDLEKIAEAEEYVNEFMATVDIIDNIRNPTGIYKYVRDFALTIGTYYDANDQPLSQVEIEQVKRGEGEAYKKISYYKKHHPLHYVIILVDHISLLEPESEEGVRLTQWQTIGKFSSKYCLAFRDKFGFIPVVVQQQASAKEQVEYNYKGKSIEEKLEPSLDGLGDNKTTQRDANVVIGLFAPERYGITSHNGYETTILRDRYRSMSLLKDRDGASNFKLPLFFNGATDYFRELPRVDDVEGMRRMYEWVRNLG
jgi:hypothetical protein